MTYVEYVIPVKTISEANKREHWAKKANRRRTQREAAKEATLEATMDAYGMGDYTLSRAHLVRVGRRKLDSDNLAGSMKSVRDGIADAFGMDDAKDIWSYDQDADYHNEYLVLVCLELEEQDGAE